MAKIITESEALNLFEQSVEIFENTEKDYILSSEKFYNLCSDLFKKYSISEDEIAKIEEHYVARLLDTLENVEFPDVLSWTVRIQKDYRECLKNKNKEIKNIIISEVLEHIKTTLGNLLVRRIIWNSDLNDLETINKVRESILLNYEKIIENMKTPMKKAIANLNAEGSIRVKGSIRDAYEATSQFTSCYNQLVYNIIGETEIKKYLNKHSDTSTIIKSKLSPSAIPLFTKWLEGGEISNVEMAKLEKALKKAIYLIKTNKPLQKALQ